MSAPISPPPAAPLLQCGACNIFLGADLLNTAAPVACPSCHAAIQARVFPALFRPLEPGRVGEDLLLEAAGGEAEAACFFHPRKRAAVPCAQCGRFLCGLCDLDFGDGRHFCPECLRNARQTGRLPELESERPAHDRLALLLGIVSLALGPLALFIAPAALYLVIRSWREPSRGPVPATGARLRLVVALGFSVLAFTGWAIWLYLIALRQFF